jgi:WD40 repeat protein
VSAVELRWSNTSATTANLFRAEVAGCDFANYATCPGGTLTTNVTSPYVQTGLTNGQSYWFKIEARAAAGAAMLSNEASARPDQLTVAQVRAVAVAADGTAYLGGDFRSVGVRTGQGVPLDATTGLPKAFPFVDGEVFAVVSDGAGGWFIGGQFTAVGGQPRYRLAHIRSDMTVGDFNPLVGEAGPAAGFVRSLVLAGDTLYFGGRFWTVNGVARTGLAAVGTDGTLRAFSPELEWKFDLNLPPGVGNVTRLAVANDTVFVGGRFTSVNGQPRAGLAAIGADGALRSWNPGSNGDIWGMSILDDVVYLGGTFTRLAGAGRAHLGAVGTDGLLRDWSPTVSGDVQALAIYQDVVYVGGAFRVVDLQPRSSLAAIGVDGAVRAWNPNVAGIVSTLAVSNGVVYVGGQFSTIGSATRSGLAAVGTDGALRAWSPVPDVDPIAIAAAGDTVYVGGWFSHFNGTARRNLAAIRPDGTLSDWAPETNVGVDALTIAGDTVFAGGRFAAVGPSGQAPTQARSRLAAFGVDGTVRPWNPQADGRVNTLAASNDIVYVGGEFTALGSATRNRVGAVGTDGALRSWDPDANGPVTVLTIAGSDVFVGGDFTTIGGQARQRLGVVATDGVLSPWSADFDRPVRAIAVKDDVVYVAGDFQLAAPPHPYVRQGLAAFTLGSATMTAWDPGHVGSASGVAVADGVVYVSGPFTSVAGQPRRHLAALGVDGTLRDWSVSGAIDSTINVLVPRAGKVHVGGRYAVVDAAL